jgi:hypothetical protein
MSSNKLNPIYAALDSHQYNRAIKLALALPEANVLGKALLAHAYVRSGQRHMALITLNRVLGETFYELQHELNFDLESTQERYRAGTTASSAPVEPNLAASSKKGKKGKKKPLAAISKTQLQQQQTSTKSTAWDLDLIDQLDTFPSLPEKLDSFPPENAITDEITLATIAVSLQSLKLPLTAYQMYSWAVIASPSEITLRKTFCSGLHVLAAPSKWNADSQMKLEAFVLSHIQAIALQYARYLASAGGGSEVPTAWAAQVALWRLQWLPEDEQCQQLLPRLAESIVKRLVEEEKTKGIFSAETRLLGLRALELQSKWGEMLALLEDAPVNFNDGATGTPPPAEGDLGLTKTQVLRERAKLLKKLNRHAECRIVHEELLQEQPDDWFSWRGHLESSIFDDNIEVTEALVNKILLEHENSPYQPRGPHLMRVDIAADKIRSNFSDTAIRSFGIAIRVYAEVFASRAACCFSDLEKYLNVIVRTNVEAASEVIVDLLDFAEKTRVSNQTAELVNGNEVQWSNNERQSKLRAYTFALKLTHKLLASRHDLVGRYLPDWRDIVSEWKSSTSITPSISGEAVRL